MAGGKFPVARLIAIKTGDAVSGRSRDQRGQVEGERDDEGGYCGAEITASDEPRTGALGRIHGLHVEASVEGVRAVACGTKNVGRE